MENSAKLRFHLDRHHSPSQKRARKTNSLRGISPLSRSLLLCRRMMQSQSTTQSRPSKNPLQKKNLYVTVKVPALSQAHLFLILIRLCKLLNHRLSRYPLKIGTIKRTMMSSRLRQSPCKQICASLRQWSDRYNASQTWLRSKNSKPINRKDAKEQARKRTSWKPSLSTWITGR